ncbi:MAG: hypothetical protein IJS52_09730, partial [Bacilli bacterium]|nr:hypothetical protein [Bacilli bacterium]
METSTKRNLALLTCCLVATFALALTFLNKDGTSTSFLPSNASNAKEVTDITSSSLRMNNGVSIAA